MLAMEPVGDFREKFERSMDAAALRKDLLRAPEAHILIVDDTRMNLTVVVGLLKKTEIGIDAVTSGEEAIKLARSIRYDLILMDQRMPVMDGTEALRRIRAQADGANRDTPVICLTADAVSGARERYLAEGFTDYLTKPIDSAALERLLVKYLPSDKVVLQTQGEAVEPPESSGDGFEYLRAAGVDPQIGLGYCQGDEALYADMLREYLRGADEKLRALQDDYSAADWTNYGIVVHALKSSSRMIGAQALSERAAVLETAADRADTEAILREHPQMMEDCQRLADALALHIDLGVIDADDGEVLEFMPE
jgi:CheY-like chemotaxis protein